MCIYSLWGIIYNVWLHPLTEFPGPKMLAATGLIDAVIAVQGRAATNLKALHQKYGPVVRIAPGKLSFAAPSAWKKIYGQYGFPKNYEDFDQDDSIMHWSTSDLCW